MAFIGYIPRLNSKSIEKLTCLDGNVLFGNKEMHIFEVCGVILSFSNFSINICDFHGRIETHTQRKIECPEKGSYIFRLKPYIKNGNVQLFCKNYRKVSLYEEIAFNIEVSELTSEIQP